MRVFVSGVMAAALGACTPAVGDVTLAGLDLADGKTLAALQEALPPDDRAALGTYALLHWPKSKFFCGKPIGGSAATAQTVGEAIAQTKAYEAALALAQAKAPTTATLTPRAEETALITRMEQFVFERDTLYARMGPQADATPRGAEIKRRIADLREEIDALRNN